MPFAPRRFWMHGHDDDLVLLQNARLTVACATPGVLPCRHERRSARWLLNLDLPIDYVDIDGYHYLLFHQNVGSSWAWRDYRRREVR